MEDALSKLFSDFNLEKGINKRKVDDSAFSEWFRQKCKKINPTVSEDEIIDYANLCLRKVSFEIDSSEYKGLKRTTARFLKELISNNEKENQKKITKRVLTIELLSKIFPHWTKSEVMRATAFCYNFFKDLVEIDENAVIDRIIAFYESAKKSIATNKINLPYFFKSYKTYYRLKDDKKHGITGNKSEEELIEEAIYANYLDFQTEITLDDLKRLNISTNYRKSQHHFFEKIDELVNNYDQITDFDCTSSLQKVMNFARFVLGENFLTDKQRELFEILIECTYSEFSTQNEFIKEVQNRAYDCGIDKENYRQLYHRLKERFSNRSEGDSGKLFLMSLIRTSDEEDALDAMVELFNI